MSVNVRFDSTPFLESVKSLEHANMQNQYK